MKTFPFAFWAITALPPTLTGLSVTIGDIDGGYTLVATGTNFVVGGTSFSFGGTPASAVTVTDAMHATVTVPAHATTSGGTLSVTATTSGGTTGAQPFEYFSPAQLTLSGWWRGYSGSAPWAGTASGGTSGSHSLTTAGADPTGGTLNGHGTATFNGSTEYLTSSLTIATLFHTTGGAISDAGFLFLLFKATAAVAGGTGTPYSWPAVATSGASIIASFASDGFHFSLYNGGYNEVIDACATGAYHAGQMEWDGVSVGEARLDNGSWSALGVDEMNNTTSDTLMVGANFAAAAFFTGAIVEIITAPSSLGHTTADKIRAYINTRYGVAV